MSPGVTAPPVEGGDRSMVTPAPESAVDARPADAGDRSDNMTGVARPVPRSPSQGIGEDQLAQGVGLQICWQVRSSHSGRPRSKDKPCDPKHQTVLMPGAALATARATRVLGRPELADMAIHHGQSTLRPPRAESARIAYACNSSCVT